MISIKRFLEHRSDWTPADGELLAATLQLQRLLMDGAAAHRTSRDLLARLGGVASLKDLLILANEAVEAAQNYARDATSNLREQSTHMQSMVAMLTGTVADIAGQSEASVGRLQELEKQIEQASGLNDIRAVRTSLASCLEAVKEAVSQHQKATQDTMKRLRDQLKTVPQPAAALSAGREESRPVQGAGCAEYVAVFKLQRADHVQARFGESVRELMLARIGEGLKPAQSPSDRLVRWKGPTFVMFISSPENVPAVRRRLGAAVAKISQSFVEVGRNSALLAVGVDWTVFPQAQYPSLDRVFREVDLFLGVDAS